MNSGSESEEPAPPPAIEPEEPGLPDSHVFQMPMMVPHFSDGTTEVLKHGRDSDDTIVQEPTEPLFPQPTEPVADDTSVPDDLDSTQRMDRVVRAEMFAAPKPVAAPAPVQEARTASAAVSPTAVARPVATPTPSPVAAAPAKSGSHLLTIILLSYASAVTIGLIYLLMNRGDSAADFHNQLESLRDPVDEEGTVRIYQRGVELPPGHRLEFAQPRRFGNILVEPLKVTRGAVMFEHYSKNGRLTQPPSSPVLKLWLKLTNASKDQEIAPFDALLVFKRELNTAGELVSNTYVAQRGKAEAGPVVFTYPLAQSSEWDIVGQNLGRTLMPGESMETFIPTSEEGLNELSGDLEWRFHLRKGYAPSRRGVTTLVEVAFNSSRIEDEPPPPQPPAPAKGKKKA